ncbi:MAG: translation initiation factor IF-2 [Bacteroidetes bacterium]|nr:MAG: translation initiation factor IF-2 [Bacteroidota bacterium]TAG89379.1 MAG: translation initiation factor IF-2 [Bacteroidota bacterium]
MADEKMIKLSQVTRELNVGTGTIVEKLAAKNIHIENNANAKISVQQFKMVATELGKPFNEEHWNKKEVNNNHISSQPKTNDSTQKDSSAKNMESNQKDSQDKPVVVEVKNNTEIKNTSVVDNNAKKEPELIKGHGQAFTVVGKIDLADQPKNQKTGYGHGSNYKRDDNKNNQNKPKSQETNNTHNQPKKYDNNDNQNRNNQTKQGDNAVKKDFTQNQNNFNKNNQNMAEKKQHNEPKIQNKDNSFKKEEKNSFPKTEKVTPAIVVTENNDEIAESKIPIELIKARGETLSGLKVLGKIELPVEKKFGSRGGNNSNSNNNNDGDKKKRRRKKRRREAEASSSGAVTTTPNTNNNQNSSATTGANTGTSTNNNQNRNNQNRNYNNNGNNQNRNNNSGNNYQNRNNNNTQGQGTNNTTNQAGTNTQNQGTNTNQNTGGSNQNRTNNNQNTGGNNQNRTNNNSGNNQNRTNNNNGNNQNRSNNNNNTNRNNNNQNKKPATVATAELTEKQIQEQIKATLAKIGSKTAKNPRQGRRTKEARHKEKEASKEVVDTKIIKVAEFVSANDLATMMNISATQVISTCLAMGIFVSINQRLDAELLDIIADEFGYKVEFVNALEQEKEAAAEEKDDESSLVERAPIVTIMGHVDHGKTSLLDYIRKTNIVSGESGGITQHIGAYNVVAKTEKGERMITFLDTPGHEAFTAMRARGAKMTDIVVLVVAADDNVMPQTEEAISHAREAGVPIIVAVNKIDREGANPEKIRQELAGKDVLVESWGGTYQDQDISAKKGIGIDVLLEKITIQADMLELKANPNRRAKGTVIEASLDKGKGFVTNIMVQTGTMRVGDIILVGSHYGKVRAMINYKGEKITTAGPSVPVQVLGLSGAPQAGDTVKVMENEREAREIATRREQLLREQSIRSTRGLTLEEIGRRRALGNFKELKLIVKGDVDGSVEALSDSLLNLSTQEIEVKIIHKGVGQITETDINLAAASEAIIIGFQVRPSNTSRALAEKEKVQIKLYSVIYAAIEELKDAMEGMLAPKFEEIITANVEVRDVFKISKVGTIAGCYVLEGPIKRQNKVRLIRESIVVFDGEIAALKHFKQDVNEMRTSFECGISLKNCNDIRVGDIIEAYEQREIKRTLA